MKDKNNNFINNLPEEPSYMGVLSKMLTENNENLDIINKKYNSTKLEIEKLSQDFYNTERKKL